MIASLFHVTILSYGMIIQLMLEGYSHCMLNYVKEPCACMWTNVLTWEVGGAEGWCTCMSSASESCSASM